MLLQHRFSTGGSIFAYAPPSLCAIDDDGGGGAGGAGNAPQSTVVTDERSAATALEGLLDYEASGGDADNQSAASAADAGPDESEATGDEEGQHEPGDGEKPAASAIEPPNSWSAEDKAVFSKLPPEAQQIVARRESERETLVTKRTQEIADERKGWDAERTAIHGQRDQYLQHLEQLTHFAVPEVKAFAQVDWDKLATENPAEWARLSQAREALRQRLGTVQAEMQRVAGERDADLQKRREAFLGDQRKQLVEKIPEFADPEQAKKLGGELRDQLVQYGFTPEEIGAAVDHRVILIARDAMRYRQAEAARKAAEAKRQNQPPTVQRPGAAPATDGSGRAVQDKIKQFGRTNSVRDAASLLEHLL